MLSSSLAHLDLIEGLPAYPLLLSSMNACTLPLLPPRSPGSPNHGRNVGAELTLLSVGICIGSLFLTHPLPFSGVHLRPLLQHLRNSQRVHEVDLVVPLAGPFAKRALQREQGVQ